MMDYFSLLFQAFLLENKKPIKQEILTGLLLILSLWMCLLGMKICINVVCTLLMTSKHDWSIFFMLLPSC